METQIIDALKLPVEGRSLLSQMVIRLRKQSGMGLKALADVAGIHHRTVEDGWRGPEKKVKCFTGKKPWPSCGLRP